MRAITSTDSRNELDELSEPQRFRKDVAGPEAAPGLEPRGFPAGHLLMTFLAGAAVGGVLVALTSPRPAPAFPGGPRNSARLPKGGTRG